MTIFEEYKEETINSIIEGNGYKFDFKNEAVKRDLDVVKFLVGMANRKESFLSDVDINFRNNETIILAYMDKFSRYYIYNYLDEETKNNKSLIIKMIKLFSKSGGIDYDSISSSLLKDDDIQKAALECGNIKFPFTGIYKEQFELFKDKIEVEKEEYRNLTYKEVKGNEDMIIKALNHNAEIITKIPKENRYKKEYLLALGFTVDIKDEFFQEMPEELLYDKKVMKHLISKGYYKFIKNIYDYSNYKELAIICFQESFTYLPYFISVMDDKEVREAYLNSFKKYE